MYHLVFLHIFLAVIAQTHDGLKVYRYHILRVRWATLSEKITSKHSKSLFTAGKETKRRLRSCNCKPCVYRHLIELRKAIKPLSNTSAIHLKAESNFSTPASEVSLKISSLKNPRSDQITALGELCVMACGFKFWWEVHRSRPDRFCLRPLLTAS